MNNSFPPSSLEKKSCIQRKKKKVKEKSNVTPYFNADGTLYKNLQSKISEWTIQKKTIHQQAEALNEEQPMDRQ